MKDFQATLICAALGFFIGGFIGMIFLSGFFPAAWVGLLIGLGAILCPCILDNLD